MGSDRIANILKPGRTACGGIAKRDAIALLQQMCWPKPQEVWPKIRDVPTEAELRSFFDLSRQLLNAVWPMDQPPNILLPNGTGSALAPDLSKLAAGLVSDRLARPQKDDARATDRARLLKTGKGLLDLKGGEKVVQDLDRFFRFYLGRYEKDSPYGGGNPDLEATIAKRRSKSTEETALFNRLRAKRKRLKISALR
jgi:hypothetical protein